MQGIRLASAILLTGFAAGQNGVAPAPAPVPAPPAPLSVTLKKGNCASLPQGCEKSLTDKAAVQRCRANTNQDCKLEAAITKRAIANKGLTFSGKQIMGSKVTVPPIPGFTVKSINIQGEGITAESQVVFNKQLTTDPKTWTTTVTGCKVAADTKSITCPTPTINKVGNLDTIPEFFLVVVKKDKTAIELANGKTFTGSIELENKALPTIPTLTAKDAKFQLKWDDKCKVTGEDACLNEIANLAGLKKCLEGHKADGCKVTPTVKFSKKDIKPSLTGIKGAEHKLPVVAIDASDLKDSVFQLTNLKLTAINFGLQTAVTGTKTIIMNNDLKNVKDKAVTGTIDDKGHVTGSVGGGVTDFSGVVFAYLVPTDASKDTPGAFDPVIELTGPETAHEEKTHELSHKDDIEAAASTWKPSLITVTKAKTCTTTVCDSVTDFGTLGACLSQLKTACKGTSVSVAATISGGKSISSQISGRDFALFGIKSIDSFPNLNLGISSAEPSETPTAIKVTIDKIEGKLPQGTGSYDLLPMTYNVNTKQYTAGSKVGTAQLDASHKFTVTGVAKDLVNGDSNVFGVVQISRLRRLQAGTVTGTQFTDIMVTLKAESIALDQLVLAAPLPPTTTTAAPAAPTSTSKGLNGLINGGLLLTGATLMVSLMM